MEEKLSMQYLALTQNAWHMFSISVLCSEFGSDFLHPYLPGVKSKMEMEGLDRQVFFPPALNRCVLLPVTVRGLFLHLGKILPKWYFRSETAWYLCRRAVV